MNLNDFFDPVRLNKPINYNVGKDLFRKNIFINTENSPIKSKDFNLAIIGVKEERKSINKGCQLAPDKVREKLYQLSKINKSVKIADFGNLKTGHNINDAYFALRDVISELLYKNIIPIIIGGSQDLTYGIYLAYKNQKIPVNLITADPRIDIGGSKHDFDSYTYLTKIIFEKKKYLENYINIGHQSYYINIKDISLLEKLNFESVRLGEIRNNLIEIEPVIRDSNLFSIDISSIKQSDAPAHAFPSPNGYYSEEICQIARYAGISENMSSLGIFEINPKFDYNEQTVHLAAQIIWFFIDGYTNRLHEKPEENLQNFTKFIIKINGLEENIKFIKSLKSNRWWLEIPVSDRKNIINKLISCTDKDYQKACNNEISERIFKALKKIIQ